MSTILQRPADNRQVEAEHWSGLWISSNEQGLTAYKFNRFARFQDTNEINFLRSYTRN